MQHLGSSAERETANFSFGGNKVTSSPASSLELLSVRPLTHPKLSEYISKRAVNLSVARKYCSEINYSVCGRPYYAIGFPNDKGYLPRIEKLKSEVVDSNFKEVQIGSEVSAFGNSLHLYKPLVYVGKGYKEKLQVSPIPLDISEKQFLDDLIKYIGTKPNILDGKEVYVLRNQSKKGLGFFTDGNNFYPDFILWIVDGDRQIIKFIDPKGIRNSKGINDPKIQFYKLLKEKIEPQVKDANIELDSYIISNTSYLDVNWKENMDIEDFNKNHVYFQKENAEDYIEKILFF